MKIIRPLLIILSCVIIFDGCSSLKNTNKKTVIGYWKKYQGNAEGEKTAALKGELTAMEFRADKTATLTYTDRELNGKWALDNTGTGILFTETNTKTPFEIRLARVADDALGINEDVEGGERLIKFLREK